MQFNIILIYKKYLLFQPLAASFWADDALFFSLSPYKKGCRDCGSPQITLMHYYILLNFLHSTGCFQFLNLFIQ